MNERRRAILNYGAPNLERDKEEKAKRNREAWIGVLTSVAGLLLTVVLYWLFRKWL